jgi:hypothetical protein
VKDEVPTTLHHVVAAVVGCKTNSCLLKQFTKSTLHRKFITLTVTLGEGPFVGTSPFDK